jgi:hypothetical protein
MEHSKSNNDFSMRSQQTIVEILIEQNLQLEKEVKRLNAHLDEFSHGIHNILLYYTELCNLTDMCSYASTLLFLLNILYSFHEISLSKLS